jgi:transcriptional pleiotropic regulator of transition state genes
MEDLGRVCLPIQLRRTLGVGDGDSIEFFTDDDSIIIRKHQSSCIFCGSADDLSMFNGKVVCPGCLMEIRRMDKQ